MAKFELTFWGVTGTLNSDGSPKGPINITMTTGSEHKEGYCYYKVPWTKTALVRDPNDPRKSSSVKSEGSGTTCFALNLQNGRFTKKMYSQNEIHAEVQIAPGTKDDQQKDDSVTLLASIPRDTLEASFLNKKVILKCDDKLVCDDYFVQEIKPTYKKDAMYVTFKMYSPDFLLTQEDYCRTFVSQKLGEDILKNEIKN